jgi:tRNA(fMet)-specific endonuclease VapC
MSQEHTILLDSTVLIDVLRNRKQMRAWLLQQANTGRVLATSTICTAEVFGGLRPGEERATRALLTSIDSIDVSPSIAELAGTLKAALRSRGQTRSIMDMIVAATALERDLPLATDNRKDFVFPGLTLFPLP